MLRFKPEVRVGLMNPYLAEMLTVATEWSLINRVDVRVNSINDGPGVHMQGSLHYANLAADFGPDNDKPGDRDALANYFRQRMPNGYDVVFEGDHVHVEFDPHRPALMKVPT